MNKAYEQRLMVILGLDLGYGRKGFDNNDEKAVKVLFERVKKEIMKYTDHPALLMWGGWK